MKSIIYCSFLLVIASILSNCARVSSTAVPTHVEKPVASLPPLSPTPTFTPTVAVTSTLPSTLESDIAKRTIGNLLQDFVDCEAPCFWGILPGKTTLRETTNTFAHLGLSLKYTTTLDGKDFYAMNYNLDNGIEVSTVIAIQNNIVTSLDVGINDTSPEGTPRKWSAYSPETLIKRYGSPSRVDFFLGRVAPAPTHSMDLYFEEVKLIVEYIGNSLLNDGPQLEICPIANKVEHIHVWMGDDPQYPPSLGVPLEEATPLTMEEFSNLMTGDPNNACFNLKEEAFPQ